VHLPPDERDLVDEPDLVRCLACLTVYAKPVDARDDLAAVCPACGYAGWLAVRIPPPETARSLEAYSVPIS
jgi:hypothetical protein